MSEHQFRAAQRKVVTRNRLAEIVHCAKAEGKSVVFTNGCFDILHVGHVRYLQDARALGDMLIMGVNSDESVSRLKGPDRPLVQQDERAEVLAALECVDYITIFPEDTPIELLEAVKPSIHVKGGDYRMEDLPEAEVVIRNGGRVEIVSFSSTRTRDKSTTGLIGKIVKTHK